MTFYSAPEVRHAEWTPEGEDKTKKSIEQVFVFSEVPYKITLEEYEKSGLDVIFFGQDHFDTMAILQDKTEMDQEEIKQRKGEQKLLSNRDLLGKNFTEVIRNLKECENYV